MLVSFNSNVTAGNLLVVAVSYQSTTGTATITDTQGNTYATAVGPTPSATLGFSDAIMYTVAQASGSNTVGVSLSGSFNYRRLVVHEYSGVDTFDVSAGAIGAAGSGAPTASATTSNANELIFGWAVSNNGTTSAGSGFTLRATAGSESTEDQIVSSAGTQTVVYPNDGSAWIGQIATFYKASMPVTLGMPWLYFQNTDPSLFQNLMGQYDFVGGTTDSSGQANNATIVGGVTAATGRKGDANSAYTFNGSTGYMTTTTSFSQPQTYSINAWFKTNTSGGGEMVGLADTKGPTPTHYDRHLLMDTSGHVIFGVYNNTATQVAASTGTYNDNQWHMATATMSPTGGMILYVDGIQVATNTNTVSENYTGYWIMGYNNFANWNQFTSGNYFAGTLDDVKIYSITLTPLQIAELYVL